MKLKLFVLSLFFFLARTSDAQQYSHWKAGEILLGQNNERYRLENYVGEGGFKTAWKASRLDTNNKILETVIVLEIDSRLKDPRMLKAIVDSNRAAASIANTGAHGHLFNIRQTGYLTSQSSQTKHVDVVFADEAKHNAMAFFKEQRLLLDDPIHVKIEKLRRIGDFTDKVSNMLSVLREHGYAHGDVKFNNILITEANTQLADFDSIAKIGEEIGAGTLSYLAPESCSPKNPNFIPRSSSLSDEFANGVMLYEMIFSEVPINGYLDYLEKENHYVEDAFRKALASGRRDVIFMTIMFHYDANFPDEPASFSSFIKKRIRNKVADLLHEAERLPAIQQDEAKKLIRIIGEHLEARLKTDPTKRKIPGNIRSAIDNVEIEQKVKELCAH